MGNLNESHERKINRIKLKELINKTKQNVADLTKLKERELNKKRRQESLALYADALSFFQFLATKSLVLSWDNNNNNYVTADGKVCSYWPYIENIDLNEYITPSNFAGKWYKEINLNKNITTGFEIKHYNNYQELERLFNFKWGFPSVSGNHKFKKNEKLVEKHMMKKGVNDYLLFLEDKLDVNIKLWYWASSRYEIWYRTIRTNGFRFEII